MKKPITDEKFYIINIPKDIEKMKELIKFLGDECNWEDFHFKCMIEDNINTIWWDKNNKDYTYGISMSQAFHMKITYDDLMANYIPKDTFLNDAVDEALKEVAKNEDKPNKVKNINATHYELWNGFEAIDIIKNTLSKDEYIGYLKGNILKYQLRLGKKDNVEKEKEKIKDYQNELNEILGDINEQ